MSSKKINLVTILLIFLELAALLITGNSFFPANPVKTAQPAATTAAKTLSPDLIAAYTRAIQQDTPPAYRPTASGGKSFLAQNQAQAFRADFSPTGVKINDWGLRLSGYSYAGQSQIATVEVNPVLNNNRVEYHHANGLTEWYSNFEMGLEQGFTLEKPLAQTDSTGSQLALNITLQNTTTLPGGSEGWVTLGDGRLYGGLVAWDANHRLLTSHLTASGNNLKLLVDLRDAVYPVTIDPLIQQQKFTALDTSGGDQFGGSAALSSDGTTAIVGAIRNDSGQGAAYVFIRSGGSWAQQQKLTASDAVNENQFGSSVDLSSDGNTAIVGADTNNSTQGKAYIFTRSGNVWTQQQIITASDETASDHFGFIVNLSGNSTTAIVGAYNAGGQGGAYIFSQSGGTWSQQQKLTASDGVSGDQYGYSVALNGNGNTAIVGANNKNSATGETYIYTRSGSTWTEQQRLTASDGGPGDYFGYSVSLSSDGNTAITSASIKNSEKGEVYVYTRSGGSWALQQAFGPGDDSTGRFGNVVSLSDDGNIAMIAAQIRTFAQGGAYIFTRHNGTWSKQQVMTSNDLANGDNFGTGAAMSGDGRTGLFGAIYNGGTGAVYAFGFTSDNPILNLASSSNPSVLNQSVTFTASFTGAQFTPTGLVTFYIDNVPTTPVLLDSSGQAAYSITNLAVGPHLITASYAGDNSNNPTSTQDPLDQEVKVAVDHFTVSDYPSPTTSGESHDITVTARDSSNNLFPDYNGTVHFTSTDPLAILPADAILVNGVGTFQATLKTAGIQSLTATDIVITTGASGSQTGIQVLPGAVTHLGITGYPSQVKTGTSHDFIVSALDAAGNTVPGYSGTVHFTSTDPQAVLPADATLVSGVGTFQAIFNTVGTQTLTATDVSTSSITGAQMGILVQKKIVEKRATLLPPANLTGQLLVSPDRVASPDPANTISYTFTVKNTGQGQAGSVTLTFPVDPKLVLGYTTFTTPGTWVSNLSTDSVVVTLPNLSYNQVVSGTLVFRPATAPTPTAGSTVSTRYDVSWANPGGSSGQAKSNSVSFTFGEVGGNQDVSAGKVQLLTTPGPAEGSSKVTYHGDFWIADEAVSGWLTKPDGTSVALNQGLASTQGSFDIMVDTAGLAPGTYVVAAYGQTSQIYGSGLLVVGSSGTSHVKQATNLTLKALGQHS